MKAEKVMREMQTYITIASLFFLVVGIFIGSLAFPRYELIESQKESPIFVEHNGEGVTYRWDNSKNIYTLYPGVFYDNILDRYFFRKDAGMYTYAYPCESCPSIPPIKRYYPQEVEVVGDPSEIKLVFRVDESYQDCFIDWIESNLSLWFGNVTFTCEPEIEITNFKMFVDGIEVI